MGGRITIFEYFVPSAGTFVLLESISASFWFFLAFCFNDSLAFSAYLSILHSETERKRERREPGHVISYLSYVIYGLRFPSVMVMRQWGISNFGRKDFKEGIRWTKWWRGTIWCLVMMLCWCSWCYALFGIVMVVVMLLILCFIYPSQLKNQLSTSSCLRFNQKVLSPSYSHPYLVS